MSADGYSLCPKCNGSGRAKPPTDPATLYGKVSQEEYEAAVVAHREWKNAGNDAEETVREYQEMGMHKGNFFVEYGGECWEDACGFKFNFSIEINPITGKIIKLERETNQGKIPMISAT